jgi:hypothetical protein
VWDETLLIMKGLFEDVWGDGPEVVVEHAVDVTLPVKLSLLCPTSHTLTRPVSPHQIALFVIGVAGFGRRIGWKEDAVVPPGHAITFKVRLGPVLPRERPGRVLTRTRVCEQDALHTVSENVFSRLAMPDWLLNLGPTKYVRDVKLSFDELEVRAPTAMH